jgi:hypothetical protein
VFVERSIYISKRNSLERAAILYLPCDGCRSTELPVSERVLSLRNPCRHVGNSTASKHYIAPIVINRAAWSVAILERPLLVPSKVYSLRGGCYRSSRLAYGVGVAY